MKGNITDIVKNFKLGGEISKNLLQNFVPKPENPIEKSNPTEKPNPELFKLKTHLVLYGIAQTVLICTGEIISFLNKKKVKHEVVQQEEVANDLAKFPPFFKKIKTPEVFQPKGENDIYDPSRKSSGQNDAQCDANLNYLCPMDMKVGVLSDIRKTFNSLDLTEIAKSALSAISLKITG